MLLLNGTLTGKNIMEPNSTSGEFAPEPSFKLLEGCPGPSLAPYSAVTEDSKRWEHLNAGVAYQDEVRGISAQLEGGTLVATLFSMVVMYALASYFQVPFAEKLVFVSSVPSASGALVLIQGRVKD